MNGYNNPEVFQDPAPVGVDWAIEKTRLALFQNVPWLEKIFPRAYVQQRRSDRGISEFFPEAWMKNREPINLMPNDNLSAFSFFLTRDPETPQDYDAFQQLILQRPVSLIMWCNLKRVDPSKPYRFAETLKLDLLAALSKAPDFRLTNIYESWGRIYEGFTVTEHFQGYLKPPYYAVRIDGNMMYAAYAENCFPGSVPHYLLNEDGTVLLGEDGQQLIAD